MEFYGYWRSSASWRVRIALALKGVEAAYRPVNILKGEQHAPAYRRINPQGVVPALVDGGTTLVQSFAIVEYLEERFPDPPLLPRDAAARARARAIAQAIACEAQPFQNLRTQTYLRDEAGLGEAGVRAWLDRWIGEAMRSVEAMVSQWGGAYCVGDAPTLADVFLVPQIYAAQRFKVDLSNCPRLLAINERCMAIEAFASAHPDRQPDAVKS